MVAEEVDEHIIEPLSRRLEASDRSLAGWAHTAADHLSQGHFWPCGLYAAGSDSSQTSATAGMAGTFQERFHSQISLRPSCLLLPTHGSCSSCQMPPWPACRTVPQIGFRRRHHQYQHSVKGNRQRNLRDRKSLQRSRQTQLKRLLGPGLGWTPCRR